MKPVAMNIISPKKKKKILTKLGIQTNDPPGSNSCGLLTGLPAFQQFNCSLPGGLEYRIGRLRAFSIT